MVTSSMAEKAFAAKVAVLDQLIQEVQELADLYVRLLEVDAPSGDPMVNEHVAGVLQALAKTRICYRHAESTVAASITAIGGLEVRSDQDF